MELEIPNFYHKIGSSDGQANLQVIQGLSKGHVISITEDSLITLITQKIPRVLGALCQKNDEDQDNFTTQPLLLTNPASITPLQAWS